MGSQKRESRLSIERSTKMAEYIEDLGCPVEEQHILFSAVLNRPVNNGTDLTEREAREVYNFARALDRYRKALQ